MNRKLFKLKKLSKKVKPDNDLEYLQKVFYALSAQTGCPIGATAKYFRFIKSGILNEGAGFLKVLASQPILGLRVLGKDLPNKADYGLKVRSRTGFPVVFGWHYQRLKVLSKREPTSQYVLQVRRILTLFSIGKMLVRSSGSRIRRERILYAQRVQRQLDEARYLQLKDELLPDILEFLDFLRFTKKSNVDFMPGHYDPTNVGNVVLDPRVYSLKSLAKGVNRPYKFFVPAQIRSNLLYLQGTVPRPLDYRPDGKQCVIVEPGGKFRGITPYYSPLIHSTSVYTTCRRLLYRWIPDVSLDQAIGHERTRVLTMQNRIVVSADASNFTDSIDLDLARLFLDAIGESGFLDYLGGLKISTISGIISTPLPLMGLKGCYELSCCLLAYSVWRQSKQRTLTLNGMAHACDDLVGHGTREGFERAYNFIGASLNKKKTVVSKSTAVFCGQMYWKGNRVTPVRLNLTRLATSTSGSIILPMCRDFLTVAQPVWGPSSMRIIRPIIKRACLRCVSPNSVRFDLPAKLGGIPIEKSKGVTLVKQLERRSVLRYCLYNTPIHQEPPDRLSSLIGNIRLGRPAIMPDGKILPSVTLPNPGGPGSWKRRKLRIDQMIDRGELSDIDVLEYYYS